MTHRESLVKLQFGFFAVILLAQAASAADSDWSKFQPSDWKTPMGAKGTAYDAARHIFTDATLNENNQLVLNQDKLLRMPGTSKHRAILPQGTTLSGVWFPQTVRSQGKKYTVLLWDGQRPENSEEGGWGDGVAVIAIFPEGSSEPTDVAEVKQDKSTSLGDLVNLGDEDAFMVLNNHSNSGQSYTLTGLFHLRDGRLRRIAEDILTLTGNSGCAQSFDEALHWQTEPDGINPPRITATVTLIHAPQDFVGDDCVPKPKSWTESFRETYRWNTAKGLYKPEGGTLDRLSKWNESKM